MRHESICSEQFYEGKRDVILFCIDCSPSMLEMREDERYEDGVQTCNLMIALEAAMQIMKKKVLVGPNDAVGIMLFNTVRQPYCGASTLMYLTLVTMGCYRRRGMRVGRLVLISRRARMSTSPSPPLTHRRSWSSSSSWMVSKRCALYGI